MPSAAAPPCPRERFGERFGHSLGFGVSRWPRRFGVLVALMVALAGCDAAPPLSNPRAAAPAPRALQPAARPTATRPTTTQTAPAKPAAPAQATAPLRTAASSSPSAPLRIAVSNREIVIAGPAGYCIDQPAARETATTAFILLGSCAAIARSASAQRPVVPAVLTASVGTGSGESIATQLPALNSFFTSDAGRAVLARSGRASAVTVMRAKASDGVFYLAARDTSPANGTRVQADFWRAVFDLKGRIVTLNVTGLRAAPLGPAAGQATLEAFVRQVRNEN